MLSKHNFMVESHETAGNKGNAKLALASLLATVGVAFARSSESAAQNAQPATEEVKLANAEEATVFASLPRNVQAEIRAAYAKCMAEVEEFAEDASGGDPAMKQVLYDDGVDDCDSIRNSDIRIKKAEQNIEERTARITSG